MKSIELKNLSAQYGQATLNNVSTSIGSSITGLAGNWQPLLACLSGQTSPTGGSITIDGNSARSEVMAGRIGIMPPQSALPKTLCLVDWLIMANILAGKSRRWSKRRASAIISLLQLQSIAKRLVGQLAPVEVYAAELAIAFASDPKWLLIRGPKWLPETTQLEQRLLATLSNHASLVIITDEADSGPTIDLCDSVIRLSAGSLFSGAPQNRNDISPFSVIALECVSSFVDELHKRGASASLTKASVNLATLDALSEREIEMIVWLPRSANTSLLVDAALASETALLKVVALPQEQHA